MTEISALPTNIAIKNLAILALLHIQSKIKVSPLPFSDAMFKFLQKKKNSFTIGLQLSEDFVSLLLLDNTDIHSPTIKDYIHYPVSAENSLEKVESNIAKYIASNQLEKVPSCLVLDDKDYQLFVIEAPLVPKNEMAEAVKWKIKDLLQFPLADAVIDVFLQPDVNQEGKNIANVVVAQKNIIEKKSQFIQNIGLSLLAIDIPELAYRNYFEKTDYHDKNIALVLIKENYGKLLVLKNSQVCFSRSFSISYKGGIFDELPESEIVLELQRSLDYYERQLKQSMPTNIVFIGESLMEDKITSVTTDSLNQQVTVEKILNYELSDEDSLLSSRVIASYGAALRKDLIGGVSQ